MRATLALILMIASAAPRAACASAEAFRWRSIETDKDFQPLRAHLQHLVDGNATDRVNRLCVIGQVQPGTYENAYVYWPTANKLILWAPDRDTLDDIAKSRRYLDLGTDVVAGDDVHGSTYRVTRSWVDAVIRACRRHGRTMTIVKRGAHG